MSASVQKLRELLADKSLKSRVVGRIKMISGMKALIINANSEILATIIEPKKYQIGDVVIVVDGVITAKTVINNEEVTIVHI